MLTKNIHIEANNIEYGKCSLKLFFFTESFGCQEKNIIGRIIFGYLCTTYRFKLE